MKEGSTYYLSADIIGPYSGRIYGHRGDQVTLIAIHNKMAILEKGAVRFPGKLELLTESEQQRSESAIGTEKESGLSPKKRSAKKPKNKISSLF